MLSLSHTGFEINPVQLKLFAPFLRSCWKILLLGMLALVTSTLLLVKSSMLLGDICARVGSGDALNADVQTMMVFFVVFEISSIFAQFLGRHCLARGTTEVLLNLRCALFSKLASLPMGYFDSQPLGRTITRLTNDVEGVEGFFGGGLARIVTASVQILLVLIGIISIAPGYGFVVLLSAMPCLSFSWITRKPVRYWLTENKIRNAHVNSTLAEFIQGLPVLRVLGLENWSGEEFSRENGRHLESSIKVLSWNSFIRPVTVFLSVMPTLVAVVFGGWLLMNGHVELAAIIAIIRLTERFSNPVRVLTQEIQVIQDATTSAVRVGEMLKEPEERARKEQALDQVRCVIGEIAFKDIALAYKSGREVLKAINLVIPAGQKLGIVGPTGAGKSSLLNLIPGLYVPHEGMVMIDGVDLKAWNLSNLRGQIGYLAQDPFLSHGSLAANILGLDKEQDSQAIAKFFSATQSVGLAGVLDRFTGGMNFHIREGGSNLSSGEKQMIAFLRLIYEDRPILLLDEATSCLDRDWESAIQKAILALMKQRRRTCVIIAHRTETLRSCDRIIRIKSGRLVADGVPQDVLPRGLDLLFNTD